MSYMEGVNLYSIDYYKKTVFKGSYRGVCFRIGKAERPVGEFLNDDFGPGDGFDDDSVGISGGSADDSAGEAGSGAVEGGGIEMEDCLRAQVWKGPYILEKTDEEVFEELFDYSDDGLNAANDWIAEKQKEIITMEVMK